MVVIQPLAQKSRPVGGKWTAEPFEEVPTEALLELCEYGMSTKCPDGHCQKIHPVETGKSFHWQLVVHCGPENIRKRIFNMP
jgi:hypothetical protein